MNKLGKVRTFLKKTCILDEVTRSNFEKKKKKSEKWVVVGAFDKNKLLGSC